MRRKYTSNVRDWSTARSRWGPHLMLIFWSLSPDTNVRRSPLPGRSSVRGLATGSFVEVAEAESQSNAMIPTSTVSPPVKIGLRLTGIWPNSSVLFKLLWTSVMGIGLIFQYRYIFNHFNTNDLSNLIDGFSTTLPYNLLFFKLVVLWIKNRYVFCLCGLICHS